MRVLVERCGGLYIATALDEVGNLASTRGRSQERALEKLAQKLEYEGPFEVEAIGDAEPS